MRQRCEEQALVSCSLFQELGMSGDNEAESPFFRGRRKCVKFTQLCDVGRRTTNAIPLW